VARDWEQQLRDWGKAPGTAEQTKMENTEGQIRAAITASTALGKHNVTVHAQGSYKNLTHVPRESDVDVRVVCHDIQFSDMLSIDPTATSGTAARAALLKRFGLSDATYAFETFRDDVGAALIARFGPDPNVKPGDKAFSIRETRYRVDSDVVAVIPNKVYRANGAIDEGVAFKTRKASRLIVNWPEQQFRNGITKNQATGERFKAMVRVIKNLRYEMDDAKLAEAGPIASFLIECLVWNVPDNLQRQSDSYIDSTKRVLSFLYTATKPPEACLEWTEESGLKWLFKNAPGWTPAQVNAFVLAAWAYVGF
jgi:hypothetical protein